jgi:hypothetical protein
MIYIRVPFICLKTCQLPNCYQLTRLLSVTCRFIVWYINMVLIFRTQRVEKCLLEIFRFNRSTDFGGVLKMHCGELKVRFLQTAPTQIVWYIRNIFDCLEVNKCVFIWNMFYIRDLFNCFKSYRHNNIYLFTRLYSVTGMIIVWYINMVLILRKQWVEKSLVQVTRFNLSTEYVWVIKMHFVELKIFFFQPLQFTEYDNTKLVDCWEVTKCVIDLNSDLNSCSYYLFQKLSQHKFRWNYYTVFDFK